LTTDRPIAKHRSVVPQTDQQISWYIWQRRRWQMHAISSRKSCSLCCVTALLNCWTQS